MQEIIEFYLKNEKSKKGEEEQKTDEEIKENVERFKINCVLGNNGGGKEYVFYNVFKFLDKRYSNKNIFLKTITQNQKMKY